MPATSFTLRAYHQASRSFRTAILMSAPLFAVYEAGLALLTSGEVRNAAEVLIKAHLGLIGREGALILNGIMLVLFLLASVGGQDRRVIPGVIPFMVLESAAYASFLAPVTLAITGAVRFSTSPGLGGRAAEAILGVGAGLYEELLFRLVLIAGGHAALRRLLKVDPIWSRATSLLGSSVAFSAFHHLGSLGEPWNPGVFVFRFIAGLLLGCLFLLRGFGIVIWTHALYDVFLALR